MNRRNDPFFDVPKTITTTTEGEVQLPICYFDASHYMALFRVDAARAAAKLQDVPLEPVLVSRKALAILSFFKYRDTALGPYHEVGLALLVTRQGQAQALGSVSDLLQQTRNESLGSYVLDLPVSTPLAKAAGCEIWGYPKFVTQLPIELEANHFQAQVLDPDGRLILALAGERGHVLPEEVPGMALVTYSMHGGRMLRTARRDSRHVPDQRRRVAEAGDRRLAAPDGKEPSDLGLDGQTPKLLQTTEDFQSLLFGGQPV